MPRPATTTDRLRWTSPRTSSSSGCAGPTTSATCAAGAAGPPWRPLSIDQPAEAEQEGTDQFGTIGDSPVEVREKVHESAPMTLAEAVRRMELVGHDFFLFHDSDNDRPSVVYRRRGWSYGVIHLDVQSSGGEINGTDVAALRATADA